jgi:competence protein ComFC
MLACCAVCAKQKSPIERILAVARFEDLGREAVHTLKYHGRYAISGMMGRLMAIAAEEETDVTLVTHVPLHSSRRRERGFDQSAKLAKNVADALRVPYRGECLRRSRKTRQQALLSREERVRNVAGAFLAGHPMNHESVLLVDDVLTTGATLQAAANALREAGAEGVIGLVFAHAE